jgi:hypothetical protein
MERITQFFERWLYMMARIESLCPRTRHGDESGECILLLFPR